MRDGAVTSSSHLKRDNQHVADVLDFYYSHLSVVVL